MPNFYTSVILLINRSKEIGEKQFPDHTHLLFLALEGAKIAPTCTYPFILAIFFIFKSDQQFLTRIFLKFFFLLVAIATRISQEWKCFSNFKEDNLRVNVRFDEILPSGLGGRYCLKKLLTDTG